MISVSTKPYTSAFRAVGIVLAVFAIAYFAIDPATISAKAGLSPLVRIDTINGQDPSSIVCPSNPLSSPVVIRGSGQGSTPPGRVEQYGVQINWGDGTPIERATAVFTPPTGGSTNFTFTFTSAAHTYANGSYTITLALFHSGTTGQDNQIDATTVLNVCTFNPVTPALSITTINSVSPSNFSCPDNPAPSPIILGGNGVGSAPPGNVADYSVLVNWGDGSPAENATAVFTPTGGEPVNFSYTFTTPQHTYAVSGNYTATVSLARATATGPQVVVSNTVAVCAFTPIAPEIAIELVNDVDPDTLTCPANPLSNDVTVSGSGQGSAPPANVQDYSVVIDFGDGSPTVSATAAFTPPTGTLVNFTYTYTSPTHTYTDGGNFTVTASLVYSDPTGAVIAATTSTDICVVIPRGTVTGSVYDSLTGESLFGATIEDITDLPATKGSFPGGNAYVIQPVPGLRTLRVRAKGWQDGIAQVQVVRDQVAVRDFVLTQVVTTQNIVAVQLPVGANSLKMFLLPEVVEAVVNGVVVDSTTVHAGPNYFFVGLPNGVTTFRGRNTFYNVSSTSTNLNQGTTSGIAPRDDRGYTLVKLPTTVPDAGTRAAVVTGGVQGVTRNGTLAAPTTVYATFPYNGLPVTVSTATTSNGVYVIDLVPPGTASVYASGTGNTLRSVNTSVSIVGGVFTTQNLGLFAFDPVSQNFVPVISAPETLNTNEDLSIPLSIDALSVTDLNNAFSVSHTLQVYPGYNYALSNKQSKSAQIDPTPNFSGLLTVPVTVSDGTTTSQPFDVTVSVNAQPDPSVFVNFDTGTLAASGGKGTVEVPYRRISEALPVVDSAGQILIGGITVSREPLFLINKAVTLRNNNPGGEPVTINPSLSGVTATTTTTSGFVAK